MFNYLQSVMISELFRFSFCPLFYVMFSLCFLILCVTCLFLSALCKMQFAFRDNFCRFGIQRYFKLLDKPLIDHLFS